MSFTSEPPEAPAPARSIGRVGAFSIVLGSMLGVGIFLNPRLVADASSTPLIFLAYWLLGGIVALCGAMSFAELGALFPKSGGEYVFLRRAFGPSVATAAGWTMALIIFPGSIAAMAVALVEYEINPLLSAFFDGYTLGRREVQAAAIACVALFTATNAMGASFSARAQAVLVLTPLVFFGGLSLAGFALVDAVDNSVAIAGGPSKTGLSAFSSAFLAVYFAYSGWNGVAYVAGEVRSAERVLPRALIGGTAFVTAIYLVLGAFFLHTVGLGALRETFETGTASAVSVFGQSGRVPMLALIGLAVLSSINATVLGGARVAHAIASDGLLPRWFVALSPRTHVPTRALWLQFGVSIALIVTGTFERLLELTSVTMLLIGFASVAALFAIRRAEPDAVRPFRVPLYPFVPAFFLLATGLVIGDVTWAAIRTLIGADGAASVDTDALYLLIGIVLFFGVIVGHKLWRGLRRA